MADETSSERVGASSLCLKAGDSALALVEKVGPHIAYHLSKEYASFTLFSRTQVLYRTVLVCYYQKGNGQCQARSFKRSAICYRTTSLLV